MLLFVRQFSRVTSQCIKRPSTEKVFLLPARVDNDEGALTGQNTKRRILVVDDQPDITLTIEVELEEEGLFDVDTFTDPDLALSCFKPDLYQLVILDIMMPKMDGFELYERLKKVDPCIKVCFLTASEMYHEEIREEKYSDLANEIFIQKPISTEDLIRKINNMINSK